MTETHLTPDEQLDAMMWRVKRHAELHAKQNERLLPGSHRLGQDLHHLIELVEKSRPLVAQAVKYKKTCDIWHDQLPGRPRGVDLEDAALDYAKSVET